MKSGQNLDNAGSKTPAGAGKVTRPDEKNSASKKTELTDDQIATISGGMGEPPPLDPSPGN